MKSLEDQSYGHSYDTAQLQNSQRNFYTILYEKLFYMTTQNVHERVSHYLSTSALPVVFF